MKNVPIPTDKLSAVKCDGCSEWLLAHTEGGVQGRFTPTGFVLAFDDAGEAFRDPRLK